MDFDAEAVRAFEHAGWQNAAAAYSTTFARATSGFIEALLDAARIGPGMQMLDLACGPVSPPRGQGTVAQCPWGSISLQR